MNWRSSNPEFSCNRTRRAATFIVMLTFSETLQTTAPVDSAPGMDAALGAHCTRTAVLAVQIGTQLGMPGTELKKLWLGAQLHDIGKVEIPDEILDVPRALSPSERTEIERHPELGYASIKGTVDPEVAAAVLYHHERVDGFGYPFGLVGDDIPRIARVVAVADAYDVIRSVRPYKTSWSLEFAVRELHRNAGTQFDADVVTAALAVIGSRPMGVSVA